MDSRASWDGQHRQQLASERRGLRARHDERENLQSTPNIDTRCATIEGQVVSCLTCLVREAHFISQNGIRQRTSWCIRVSLVARPVAVS